MVHQTLVKYYKKLVNCEKIIQKWVSIYETCESDIGAPDIHELTGCQRDPRDRGVTIEIYSEGMYFSRKTKMKEITFPTMVFIMVNILETKLYTCELIDTGSKITIFKSFY